MIETMKVKTENTGQAAKQGYVLATDIADYLVKKGEPFRNAHDIVARLVNHAIQKGKDFSQLNLGEYKEFSPLFEEDIHTITVESSLSARNNTGGTAPERVAEALSRAKNIIADRLDIE